MFVKIRIIEMFNYFNVEYVLMFLDEVEFGGLCFLVMVFLIL